YRRQDKLLKFSAQFREQHALSRALFGGLAEHSSARTGPSRRGADWCSRGGCAPQPLRQKPLRGLAEVNVPAGQSRDQLIVAFIREVDLRRARRVLVAQPIEPP